MNILFFTHAEPKSLPNTLLNSEECVCGPYYNNSRKHGKWKYISTPRGEFEAESVLKKLSPEQRPNMILVHSDASKGCLPRNLPKTTKRVLLIGGATHIQENPLQSLISYAIDEAFDTVVLWNRQNAHFFKQFGIPNVYWMPGLIFAIPEVQQSKERRKQLCFFGQLGKHHPRRNRIIKELQQKKIPIVGGKLPRLDSLELAGRSLISLNVSVNGELNLRVFESTSVGALLLTDRLSPHAGLEHFYEDGISMLSYDSTKELIQKVVNISKNPDQVKSIAQKGKEITNQYFSQEARRNTFFALIYGEETLEAFRLLDEPRCQLPPAGPDYRDSLVFRIQLYEFLQEQHRIFETLETTVTEGVHPLLLSDAGDLVRLSQTLLIKQQTYFEDWQAAMQELRVTNMIQKEPEVIEQLKGNVLITSLADLENPSVQESIQNKKHALSGHLI